MRQAPTSHHVHDGAVEQLSDSTAIKLRGGIVDIALHTDDWRNSAQPFHEYLRTLSARKARGEA